jgi:hypothetical protein
MCISPEIKPFADEMFLFCRDDLFGALKSVAGLIIKEA